MSSDLTFPFVHRHKTLVTNISRPDYRSVPERIEPQRTTDGSAQTISCALYDTLTRYLASGELILSQAESYEIKNGGKTYIFALRKNCWSDGSLVTAHDFERTWKYLLTPGIECPCSYYFFFLKNAKKAKHGKIPVDQIGVRALSDHLLRIDLEKSISFLLDLLTFYVFAPLHSSSIAGFFPEPHSTYYPLISNGPFKLCHWSPNVELVMDKNPHYYRAKEIYFERIRLNYLVNDLRVIDHFLQRDIDLVVKRFKILFKHKAIKLLVNTNDMNSIHLSDTCCCVFNCIDPVFRNKDLRRALSMGIDRPKLLQRLTMMGEEAADYLLPPMYRLHSSHKEFSKLELLQARQLFQDAIKAANLSPKKLAKSFTLLFPHSEFYFNLAEDIKECWEFIFDIKVRTEPMTLEDMTKKMALRNYSMAILSWNAYYHHPLSILERFRSKNNPKNYCHWNTREFVQLLQKATYASTKEESWNYCQRADEIIKEEAPLAPIFYARFGSLVQSYVKNFVTSPIGDIHFDAISFDEEMLRKRPFPEHPLAGDLVEMLRESIPKPIRKMNWYGVNFSSPYNDYLNSLRFPDP